MKNIVFAFILVVTCLTLQAQNSDSEYLFTTKSFNGRIA